MDRACRRRDRRGLRHARLGARVAARDARVGRGGRRADGAARARRRLLRLLLGRLYGGSQEALLTALAFAVAGPSTLLLKLVSLAIFALAAVLVWLVGRRTVGEPGARLAAALFWVWPPFLVWWSTKSRGVLYGSGLVIGAGSRCCSRFGCASATRSATPRCSASSLGLGVVGDAAVDVLVASRRSPGSRGAGPGVPPRSATRCRGSSSARRRGSRGTSATAGTRSFRESAAGAGTHVPRAPRRPLPDRPADLARAADAVVAALDARTSRSASRVLVLALGRLRVAVVRRPRGLEPLLVAAGGVSAPLRGVFVHVLRLRAALPRLPRSRAGAARSAGPLARDGPVVAAVAVRSSLAAWSVDGARAARARGSLPCDRADVRVPSDLGPLLELLERSDVDRVLANYWLAYRLTFESEERRDRQPDRLLALLPVPPGRRRRAAAGSRLRWSGSRRRAAASGRGCWVTATRACGRRVRRLRPVSAPPLSLNGWLRWDVLRRILDELDDVVTVLEIGAGLGAVAVRLAQRYEYVGVERDPTSFAVARDRLARLGRGTMVLGDPSAIDAAAPLRPGRRVRGARARRGRRRCGARLGLQAPTPADGSCSRCRRGESVGERPTSPWATIDATTRTTSPRCSPGRGSRTCAWSCMGSRSAICSSPRGTCSRGVARPVRSSSAQRRVAAGSSPATRCADHAGGLVPVPARAAAVRLVRARHRPRRGRARR